MELDGYERMAEWWMQVRSKNEIEVGEIVVVFYIEALKIRHAKGGWLGPFGNSGG